MCARRRRCQDRVVDASPGPVDCRHVPDLCTDVCVNFAYCADPTAQDDNCANAPPECGPVCEPYIQCIGR